MKVESIGIGASVPQGRYSKADAPVTPPAAKVESNPEIDEPTEAAQAQTPKQPGVIRNLLEGHYKGVADIRLRINFYEELTKIEEDTRSAAAQSNLDGFKAAVDAAFDELLSSEASLPEQESAIGDLRTQFANDLAKLTLAGGVEGFMQNVRKLTDSLVESVKALFAPVSEEEPAAVSDAEESPAIPSAPPTLDFETKLLQAISAFRESVENVSVLPPLSEPSGNGAAYEKFLKIYEAMQRAATAVSETAED